MFGDHHFRNNIGLAGSDARNLPRQEQLLWNINLGLLEMADGLQKTLVRIQDLQTKVQNMESRLH